LIEQINPGPIVVDQQEILSPVSVEIRRLEGAGVPVQFDDLRTAQRELARHRLRPGSGQADGQGGKE